ncbi:MAG: PhzF family phenazine biosynthesis protein [Bacillota bacterium]
MNVCTVHRVSAFTHDSKGGNEAGVVLDASKLSAAQMAQIAKTIGYSETAFILSIEKDRIEVRYFTPKSEVPLCGHATIGLLNLLRFKGLVQAGTMGLKTPAGVFPVKIGSSVATLLFPEPVILKTIEPSSVSKPLAVRQSDLANLPVAVVDAGVKELYIGLENKNLLRALNPDDHTLEMLSEAHGVSGVVFYTKEVPSALAEVRNFLPAIGIREESATGTAAAALSKLLTTYDAPFEEGIIEQGEALGKPSRIYVKYDTLAATIEISGKFRVIDTVDVTL